MGESRKSFGVVEKFNPFHDKLGRFSSASGMNSYSANPKTKAGAMAISRSAMDHGHVMNIHSESKGENISQNYQWLQTGKKPNIPSPNQMKPPKQPKQTPPKQTPNKQTQPKQDEQKPGDQQTKPTQPKQSLEAQVQDVTLSPKDSAALKQRDFVGKDAHTTKVADDHYQDRVEGKDISDTFDIRKMNTNKSPIDAIAEHNGWDVPPTVTSNKESFDKMSIKAGTTLCRSVHGDVNTGLSPTGVCKETMTNGKTSLGGSGAKLCGSGLYCVDVDIGAGVSSSQRNQRIKEAQQHSFNYGPKQMMATLHPSARIATPKQTAQMHSEFYKLSADDKARFGNDPNTYIAAKGFDGAKHFDNGGNPPSNSLGYTTIFNRSALIFYAEVAQR